MIDRSALRKQLDDAKANRGSGRIAFLKTKNGKVQRLRIAEFLDQDNNGQFARLMATWQKGQDHKSQILNRQLTLGATDAPTRLRELCDEGGVDFPYTRLRKQYLINAVDVDVNPPVMRVYAVPVTVWEKMVELLLTDQWSDLTDPQSGHPLIISQTGSGFDTEYTTQPDRKPWPIPAKLLVAVVDPITTVTDPGVAKQCELMNMTVEEVFGEQAGELDDLAPIVFEQPGPANREVPARQAAKPVLPGKPVAKPAIVPKPVVTKKPVEPDPDPVDDDASLYEDPDPEAGEEQQEEQEQPEPVVDRSRLPGAKKPVAAAKAPAKVGGRVDTASLVRGILGSGRK